MRRKTSGGWENGLIAGIEGRAEEEDGGDSANDLGEVCSLLGMERAAKERKFAVAEPLLENLITAEGVVPDVRGNGGPEGGSVEVHVHAGFPELGEYFLN